MEISRFINELENMNIVLTEFQLKQLEEYYNLILEYNEFMNLTGITDKKEVYLKHFYDSLTICRAIDLSTEHTLCDVGTGAGFPGMVLKICFPNLKVTLLDSLNKRIEFLKVVIEKLDLTEIEAISCRAEDFALKNREKYDVVTSRAVANLRILLELCTPISKKYFIPLKANCEDEVEESYCALGKLNCRIEEIYKFKLPIEESNRTILKIKKDRPTPKIFPRKYNEIKKRPL